MPDATRRRSKMKMKIRKRIRSRSKSKIRIVPGEDEPSTQNAKSSGSLGFRARTVDA